MALSDDQRLSYIIPLVVYGSAAVDQLLVNLGDQLQADAQTAFDSGIATVQPQIESLLGHALTADQLKEVRTLIAAPFNQTLDSLKVVP
jgi:hypothetical protein